MKQSFLRMETEVSPYGNASFFGREWIRNNYY